jgi:cytidine deaminase
MKIVTFSELTKTEATLIAKAQAIAKNSSSELGHQIGCLLRCKNGEEFCGATNARSRTIGSTCAERMAFDQMRFHKNSYPTLCVLIGKLPKTAWRNDWTDKNICTPCGVCLETMREEIETLGGKDLDLLCASWDKKRFLRAKLSELFPIVR